MRLTWQDAGRGTFTHRHAALHDMENGAPRARSSTSRPSRALRGRWTPCSAGGRAGLRAGLQHRRSQHAHDPGSAVSAISRTSRGCTPTSSSRAASPSGAACRASRYCCRTATRGRAPKHSSARLERFLRDVRRRQHAGLQPDRPRAAFPTMRRQMRRRFRKPLVVMSPREPAAPRAPSTRRSRSSSTARSSPLIDARRRPGSGAFGAVREGKVFYSLLEARIAQAPRHAIASSRCIRSRRGARGAWNASANARRVLGAGRAGEHGRAWRHLRHRLPARCSRDALRSPASDVADARERFLRHAQQQEQALLAVRRSRRGPGFRRRGPQGARGGVR